MRTFWLWFLLPACGSDPEAPPPFTTVVSGAPASATFGRQRSLSVTEPVRRLGSTLRGHVVAATDSEVLEWTGTNFETRNLFARPGEPGQTGPVHAIQPMGADSVMVAADQGLYTLERLFLTRLPLPDGVTTVHAATQVQSGPMEGTWLGTNLGLYRIRSADTLRVRIPNDTEVRLLAANASGLLVTTQGTYLLLPDGDGFTYEPTPIGSVNALAATSEQLWGATNYGVFRYTFGSSPPWTHYTLGDSDSEAVEHLAVDPAADLVWGSGDALFRFGQPVQRFEAAKSGPITVDTFGDVWLADGATVQIYGVSAETDRVSFAADLRPWLQTHCALCHSNQTADFTDAAVFRARAEDALRRVRAGDMPRCNGALRCGPDQLLTDYQLLEGWIRGGYAE